MVENIKKGNKKKIMNNMEQNYWIDDMWVETPNNNHFFLHAHDNYEILLFLEGDTKFIVEENTYDLEPYDVIITKKNQLHRAYHNSQTYYKRIVLNILPVFFQENMCSEYEKIFYTFSGETGNKIDAKAVKNSGLYDVLMRIKRYSQNYQNTYSPIVRAGIIEVLFLLNNIQIPSEPATQNIAISNVITYLNNHYTEEISLDILADMFYISKYHLCHVFHQVTGLTVHQYLTKKRLLFAKELLNTEDTRISQIYEKAGFQTYSSFYRAYINEFGISPKHNKK